MERSTVSIKKEKKKITLKTIKTRCPDCNKTFLSEMFGVTENHREKYQCPYCYKVHELTKEEASKKLTTKTEISFTKKDLKQWAYIFWEESTEKPLECSFPKNIKQIEKSLLEMLESLKC